MSGTIIDLFSYQKSGSAEEVTTYESGTFQTGDSLETANKVSQEVTSGDETTKFSAKSDELVDNKETPTYRIYPHVFDDKSTEGQARIELLSALKDAQLALESFGEGDISAVSSRFTCIATIMSNAHPLTKFNASLGSVVSFIRRAVLTASAAETTRSALNSLVHVLRTISENPLIDLEDASELVEKLSTDGWKGEHGFADDLIAALLDEIDLDAPTQEQLFETIGDETS